MKYNNKVDSYIEKHNIYQCQKVKKNKKIIKYIK